MRVRELRRADRGPLDDILRATGLFTEEEVTIALELIDSELGPGPDEGYLFAVAEDDDESPLGYACWGRVPMTDATFDLYWIAVEPRKQGRGVGRALLDHVESFVRAAGGRLIIVETAGKPSYAGTRAFYERTGYPEVARLPDFYRDGDDKVLHVKRLS
jgi:GNAT superfamily N-acetyltransferase